MLTPLVAVKKDETFNPLHILRFSANAVMLHPDLVADLIEQFGWIRGKRCSLVIHRIVLFLRISKNKQGVEVENKPDSTLMPHRIYTDFGVYITLEVPHLHSQLSDLSAIAAKQLAGSENFRHKGVSLDADVVSFWRWAYSNLAANNLRGHLAEFLVASDLKETSHVRVEWDDYDLRTQSGIRVEVKSAAFLQSWKQTKYSSISFGIAPSCAYDSEIEARLKTPERHSDVFVFCLLAHKDKKTLDPINLDQWEFYVLRTDILDARLGNQKTLSLSGLLRLNPAKCEYGEIAHTIETIVANNPTSNTALQGTLRDKAAQRP